MQWYYDIWCQEFANGCVLHYLLHVDDVHTFSQAQRGLIPPNYNDWQHRN
jgi:hypothetical protein